MGLRVCTTALRQSGFDVKVGEVLDSTDYRVVTYPTFFAAQDAELDTIVAGAPTPAFTQTYSTADRVVAAATAVAVATTAATSDTPFGFAEAQANAIPVAINALVADVLQLRKLITALIDDAQALGLSAAPA